jgi:hypothetical protein
MQSGSPQANKCIILASLYKEFSIYCTTDHGVKKENCISVAKMEFTTPLSSFPKYVQSIYVRTCRCSPYSLLHFLCLHYFFTLPYSIYYTEYLEIRNKKLHWLPLFNAIYLRKIVCRSIEWLITVSKNCFNSNHSKVWVASLQDQSECKDKSE